MSQSLPAVVQADVKFSGSPPYLNVDVAFRDRAHLDELINALTALRDTTGEDPDHFHLQDGGRVRRPGHSAEVTFFRPAMDFDELSFECLADAKHWLSSIDHRDHIEQNARHLAAAELNRYKAMSLSDLLPLAGQTFTKRVRLDDVTECVMRITISVVDDFPGEVLVEGGHELVQDFGCHESVFVTNKGLRVSMGGRWLLEDEIGKLASE